MYRIATIRRARAAAGVLGTTFLLASALLAIAPAAAVAQSFTIAGTVTSAVTSLPLQGITVRAFVEDEGGLNVLDESVTAANGTYQLVFAQQTFSQVEFLDYTTTLARTTQFVLVDGDETLNASLAAGGAIRGVVVAAGVGTPVADVCIDLLATADYMSNVVCTGATGEFRTYGLPVGSYSVWFNTAKTAYFSEFFDNATLFGDRDAVVVSVGNVTTANATLLRGQQITGTVTAPGNLPIANAEVRITPASGFSGFQFLTTNGSGRYASTAMVPGDYKLQVIPNDNVHVAEFYNDKPTLAAADIVTVGASDLVRDVSVAVGGSITGTIRDTANAPIDGVCVNVTSLSNDPFTNGNSCTAADGTYSVGGLSSGGYRVSFAKSGYAPEYYSNATFQTATTVNVTSPTATPNIDAVLDRLGVISGTVLDAVSGLPVTTGGSVHAIAEGGFFPFQSSLIAADGTYSLVSLQPGNYRLLAVGALGSGYASEFFDGVFTAAASTLVPAAINTVTGGRNFALDIGGIVTGTVRGAANAPLANACVTVLGADFNTSSSACTDAAGVYTVTGVAPGPHKVSFSGPSDVVPGYRFEYYNDKAVFADADSVTVVLGATQSNIDATLDRLSLITGAVTDAASGAPLASVSVQAINTVTSQPYFGSSTGTSYQIQVPAGTYKVSASDFGGLYVPEYFSDKPTLATADVMTAAAGASQTIDFALAKRAVIRGLVTSNGTPMSGVAVQAYSASNSLSPAASAFSQADGSYRFGGLAPGSYLLRAIDGQGRSISEWYSNATSFNTAAIVSLGLSDAVIDLDLAPGGRITGTVTSGGNPVANVSVGISKASDDSFVATSLTNFLGQYTSEAIPAGSYKVTATRCCPSGTSAFYDGKGSLATADPVAVTLGATTPNINITLAPLDTRGISGTITVEGTATPIIGAVVKVYTNGFQYTSTFTSADGTYSFSSLPAGPYKLSASSQLYDEEFFNGAVDLAGAQTITVTDTVLTGFNIGLLAAATGTIAGTITDSLTSLPITGVCVDAFRDGIGNSVRDCTDANGQYEIAVAVGTYSLSINKADYISQFLANPTVAVTASTATTRNISMIPGAVISGTVVDESTHAPLQNVCISLYNDAFGFSQNSRCSFQGGSFNFNGIAAGTYKLQVTSAGRYVTEWHSNSTNAAGAQAITLTTGQIVSNVEIGLVLGGTITGTVTSAGSPAPGACVEVQNRTSGAVVASGCANGSGVYQLDGVPAGSWAVRFSGAGLIPEFWNDKAALQTSDVVAVTSGGTTSNISADLAANSDTPTNLVATANAGQVGLTWTAPTTPAGPVIDYRVEYSATGGSSWTVFNDAVSTTTAATVTGLTNGTAYVFRVTSLSSGSVGTPSAVSTAVVPRAAPGAPINVTGQPGDRQVAVSWTAPSSNGGSAIGLYTVAATPGGATCTTSGQACAISGLDNGTAYTFSVVATNAAGSGLAGTSAPLTPRTVPGAPSNVIPVAAATSATLSWAAPSANGGAPITDYVVEYSSNGGLTWATFADGVSTATSATINVLVGSTTYVFRVSAKNAAGSGPASLNSASVSTTSAVPVPQPEPPVGMPPFEPLASPGRLLDTRQGEATMDGQFAGDGQRAAGSTLELLVSGRAGVPLDASSVILNVTAVDAQAPGFVTVYPCGVTRPTASNLNYATGQTIPNAVISKIGTGGRVCLFTNSAIGLVVDVAGFFPDETAFTPLAAPARLLDTRPGEITADGQFVGGGPQGAASTLELPIAGRAGVPATAGSVVLNVTVVDPTAAGFVTVYPCGVTQPTASNLNFVAGQTIPNAVVTKVGAGGKICLYTNAPTGMIVDVAGYFASATAFQPLAAPARLLDTRPGEATADGQFAGIGPAAAGVPLEVLIAGRAGVTASARSVVLNVTAVDPAAAGFVTVYPCGVTRPTASNLNFGAGQTIPNAVISKVGAGGKICLFSNTTTGLIIDVAGVLN